MTLFEDKVASLSGSNKAEFLSEAMAESEKFRADYATRPNVIKAKEIADASQGLTTYLLS